MKHTKKDVGGPAVISAEGVKQKHWGADRHGPDEFTTNSTFPMQSVEPVHRRPRDLQRKPAGARWIKSYKKLGGGGGMFSFLKKVFKKWTLAVKLSNKTNSVTTTVKRQTFKKDSILQNTIHQLINSPAFIFFKKVPTLEKDCSTFLRQFFKMTNPPRDLSGLKNYQKSQMAVIVYRINTSTVTSLCKFLKVKSPKG